MEEDDARRIESENRKRTFQDIQEFIRPTSGGEACVILPLEKDGKRKKRENRY